MSRPIYESARDLGNEARVAQRISAAWQCDVVKLKRAYAVDYALLTGRACRALCEIKVRSYSMERLGSMGGFMLSLHKWHEGQSLARAARVPFVIVVDADGELHWHSVNGEHDGLIFGGRSDRNDEQDVEPVVTLMPHRFTKLNGRA